MTNVEYAIIASMTSSGFFAYKIYKVYSPKAKSKGYNTVEVETIEPVVGSFFSFKKGESFLVSPNNLFSNKKQAIMAALKMIKSLKTEYEPHLMTSPKKLFDYVFESGKYPIKNFEKVYKKFIKELSTNG